MTADGYVVPPLLRATGRFVRRQPGTRRSPLRVSPRAFEAAGLAVPADRGQRNIYQLTRRRGEEWSPAVDGHVRRFGGELLGSGSVLCIDCDVHIAADGTVLLDGPRWLAETAAAAGSTIDLGAWLAVRSPGDPGRRHRSGWHLWARTDPDFPVRFGALAACKAVEIRDRATAPGSPGYAVMHVPGVLPMIPRWLAEFAGRQKEPTSAAGASSLNGATSRGSRYAMAAVRAEIGRLLALEGTTGTRNETLAKQSAFSLGQLVAGGLLEREATAELLQRAAEQIGLPASEARASIRSAFRAAERSPRGGAR